MNCNGLLGPIAGKLNLTSSSVNVVPFTNNKISPFNLTSPKILTSLLGLAVSSLANVTLKLEIISDLCPDCVGYPVATYLTGIFLPFSVIDTISTPLFKKSYGPVNLVVDGFCFLKLYQLLQQILL